MREYHVLMFVQCGWVCLRHDALNEWVVYTLLRCRNCPRLHLHLHLWCCVSSNCKFCVFLAACARAWTHSSDKVSELPGSLQPFLTVTCKLRRLSQFATAHCPSLRWMLWLSVEHSHHSWQRVNRSASSLSLGWLVNNVCIYYCGGSMSPSQINENYPTTIFRTRDGASHRMCKNRNQRTNQPHLLCTCDVPISGGRLCSCFHGALSRQGFVPHIAVCTSVEIRKNVVCDVLGLLNGTSCRWWQWQWQWHSEVQHLSMEAWTHRRECRGHDPAKKRSCCTDVACSVASSQLAESWCARVEWVYFVKLSHQYL